MPGNPSTVSAGRTGLDFPARGVRVVCAFPHKRARGDGGMACGMKAVDRGM